MFHSLARRKIENLIKSFIQVKSKLRGHSKRITGLAFSNSLNVLVSSGADTQVIIFHLAT